mgnify:CR=1 FL=1
MAPGGKNRKGVVVAKAQAKCLHVRHGVLLQLLGKGEFSSFLLGNDCFPLFNRRHPGVYELLILHRNTLEAAPTNVPIEFVG